MFRRNAEADPPWDGHELADEDTKDTRVVLFAVRNCPSLTDEPRMLLTETRRAREKVCRL